MIASTPGTPACAPPPPAARGAGACCGPRRRGTGLALGGQGDQRRGDARNRAHRLLGALAHRLPGFDRGGIDSEREEHLAVGHDHVGEHAGIRERRAVGRRHLGEAVENLLLGRRHSAPPLLEAPPP